MCIMKATIMNNINNFAYAIKDKNGFYYIGYNQWDKQLRKAKLYHNIFYANQIKEDNRFISRELSIVKVSIEEVEVNN